MLTATRYDEGRVSRWFVVLAVVAGMGRAETGYDAWLRYAPFDAAGRKQYERLPGTVFRK